MNRARRVVFAVALSGLLLPLLPGQARAGTTQFWDPRGDANYIAGEFKQSPHPSDPELDVLKVRYATAAEALVLTIEVQKFGVPLGAARASFFWAFTYNGVKYGVSVVLPAVAGVLPEDPTFWKSESGGALECDGCSVAHDPAANLIRAILPLKSMSAAIRAADPSQPELRPGSVFERLWVSTDRWGVVVPVGDYADGGRATFRV